MSTEPEITIPKEIILWGTFGQVLLSRDVIEQYGSKVIAVFADDETQKVPFPEVPIYYGLDGLKLWAKDRDVSDIGFCLSINMDGEKRLEYHHQLKGMGFRPATLIHPSAIIAKDAVIGEGAQIMAGVIIGPQAKIGRQCIINVKASIDHENILEDGVEISPGATLCGLVTVGTCAWIAAGATVLPMIQIGKHAIVGAGSVVNKNVPAETTVVGIPAKPRREV